MRVGALKSPLSSSLVSLTFPSPAHNVSHNTLSALLPKLLSPHEEDALPVNSNLQTIIAWEYLEMGRST